MGVQGNLEGRHALVCVASQGIGRAAALALADLGAEVTVLARRADALDALVPELSARSGTRCRALVADLDDRDGLVEAVLGLLSEAGPVQVLVNNTGGPPGGRLLDADDDALLHAFGRHVLAAHTLVRLVLPGMAESGWGRIVNVLSTSVYEPIDGLGVSNIQRAAVAAWAKTLSRELPPGVTINSVLPGFTDTERLSQLAQARADAAGLTAAAVTTGFIHQTPVGRLGRPDELAAAIAFLCSEAASFVHGVCLPVDGGRLRGI